MADLNERSKNCSYCGKPINKKDIICGFCGYNSETGIITTPSQCQSSEGAKKKAKIKSGILDSVKFIVAAVVLFVSVAFLINSFFTGKANIRGFTSIITQTINKLKVTVVKKTQGSYLNKKTTGAPRLLKKDFLDKTKEEQRKKFLQVEGIAFDTSNKSLAAINGEIVSEGDSIGNIKVKKINENSVELIVDGEIKILEIGQSILLPAGENVSIKMGSEKTD